MAQHFVTLGLLAGVPGSIVHTGSADEIPIISLRKAPAARRSDTSIAEIRPYRRGRRACAAYGEGGHATRPRLSYVASSTNAASAALNASSSSKNGQCALCSK